MKKVSQNLKQNLTPLQQQWEEMIKQQIGKPIGITVYNPFLMEYVTPVHNEDSIKLLLENTPTDDVILQYYKMVQNN